jgi:hypothetical protein
MQVIPVDAYDLGNRSYIVTDGLRAMAIDPPRPASGVLDIVRSRDLVLEIIVETHQRRARTGRGDRRHLRGVRR